MDRLSLISSMKGRKRCSERTAMNDRLGGMKDNPAAIPARLQKFLKLAEAASSLYKEGNSDQKRRMVKMFTSNLSTDGKSDLAFLVVLAVIAVIGLASASARFFVKARMATSVTVSWNTTYQTMDGFGGQTWIYGDNLTGSNADLFFSQTDGIGLSIVRSANTWNGLIPDLTTLQSAVARGAKVELGLQSPPCNLKHSYVDWGALQRRDFDDWCLHAPRQSRGYACRRPLIWRFERYRHRLQ